MKFAYIDTSVLTAIAFDEPDAEECASRLDKFTHLVSSNLLEAEIRAAFKREHIQFQESSIADIEWILPNRTLTPEFSEVLQTGYLRGADLAHVATALYFFPQRGSLAFATLDAKQSGIAKELGFLVPLEATFYV